MHKLLEKAQGVIFDVDGLLIDSEPLWQLTRDAFFKRRHMAYDQSVDKNVIGRKISDIMEFWKQYFGIEGDVTDLTKEYREQFYSLALLSKKLQLMIGASDLVRALYDEGKILAIATGGHTKEKMQDILKVFDLDKYFSFVVSSDEVKRGKPEPDVFLYTAELLHLSKEECVILEDAPNGVEAAKRAEIPVIAVQSNAKMIEEVKQKNPDILVKSLTDLL